MIDSASLGFPLCANKYSDFLTYEENSFEWAEAFGLLDDGRSRKAYARLHSGRFGHYTYWYARPPQTQLGTDLIGWLFLWDDNYPDGQNRREPARQAQVNKFYLQVFDSGNADLCDSPYARSLVDLKRRMEVLSNPRWIARFRDTLRDYFEGCLKEVLFRTAHIDPNFSEYRDFRHQSVGAYPVLDFMEIATGSILEEDVYRSSLFQDFRKTSSWILALTNDYFSLLKEEFEKDSFNAILAIMHENGLTRDAACRVFAFEHLKEVTRLHELEGQINLKWGLESAALKYAFAARSWMQGNWDWSQKTPRYESKLLNEEYLGSAVSIGQAGRAFAASENQS